MEAKKIDYKKVFQEIKLRRKLYAIIIPIVFVLSCLYIVCVPRVYAAEAVVVPEVESAGSGSGSADGKAKKKPFYAVIAHNDDQPKRKSSKDKGRPRKKFGPKPSRNEKKKAK